MFRFQRLLPVLAAVVGASLTLGNPADARAAFLLGLQEDGGVITQVNSATDFTQVSYNNTYGDFSVNTLSGSSDNGLFNTLSDLLTSDTSVMNNSSSTHTLTIYVTQQDYTQPIAGPGSPNMILESGLSGTVTLPSVTLANIFQAYADTANGDYNGLGMAFTNGSQTATANGSTFGTGSQVGYFTSTGVYSLTSVITLELTSHAKVNFSSGENVTAVPAPGGIVLALSAFSAFGIGSWVRRRKSVVA